MNKSIWKKIIIVVLSMCVLVAVALLDPNANQIGAVLKRASLWWLGGAFVSMLGYYFFDTIMFMLACRFMSAGQSFKEGVITTMIGFFYSALTPFQSGGQPMQVIQMRRRGIKVGTSTSVLVLKFLAWQFAATIISTVGLICFGGRLVQDNPALGALFVIGYLINAGVLAVGVFALVKPNWLHSIGSSLIRLAHRCRFIRKEETLQKAHNGWEKTISDYQGAVKVAFQHKLGMAAILGVALLEAICYMAVTYFVYRALGFGKFGMFYVVLLQSILTTVVSFIPLPGASIASEGGFYMIFGNLFSEGALFPAMLLWRVITYYGTLILGLVTVVIDGFRRPLHKQDKNDMAVE